ncbi:hypothetical protein [Streptomyces sp. NPDC008122]|uniref:hypothetical protein n=1 Tax=Streptomyces sp. NPDC008122 TaxID=3364810 RepID=UPI0036E8D479
MAGPAAGRSPAVVLDGLYVPAGFTSHSRGTPLLSPDAEFVWTAASWLAPTARQPLAARAQCAAALVQHVTATAYESALPLPRKGGHHSLPSLVVDSTTVIQRLGSTVALLSAAESGLLV